MHKLFNYRGYLQFCFSIIIKSMNIYSYKYLVNPIIYSNMLTHAEEYLCYFQFSVPLSGVKTFVLCVKWRVLIVLLGHNLEVWKDARKCTKNWPPSRVRICIKKAHAVGVGATAWWSMWRTCIMSLSHERGTCAKCAM
jgi:hypothetical protein